MRDTTTDLLSRIESLEVELGRLKALAMTPPAATDAPSTPEGTEHIAAEPSSRRELLRYGAVALGAAAAAGMATSPVEAQEQSNPLLIGLDNNGTGSTFLTTTTGGFGFYVTASRAGYGLVGVSRVGIYGQTNSSARGAAGVQGVSGSSTGLAPGVFGDANSPDAPGCTAGIWSAAMRCGPRFQHLQPAMQSLCTP